MTPVIGKKQPGWRVVRARSERYYTIPILIEQEKKSLIRWLVLSEKRHPDFERAAPPHRALHFNLAVV